MKETRVFVPKFYGERISRRGLFALVIGGAGVALAACGEGHKSTPPVAAGDEESQLKPVKTNGSSDVTTNRSPEASNANSKEETGAFDTILETPDGEKVNLKDYLENLRGKPVVIGFWLPGEKISESPP